MVRIDDETATQRLARAVDGAAFVAYHAETGRVFVWRTGTLLDVVRVDTGEVLGNWPTDPNPDAAAQVVAERTNAGY